MNPDPHEAQRFLDLLAPREDFTFQTFDDAKDRKSKGLINILHGSLEQHAEELAELNRQGAGVFVMVNEGDCKGRKAQNVIRVRASFIDLDGAPLEPVLEGPERPHIIINTSPGRWHCYWVVEGVALDDFKKVQQQLIKRFNADTSVTDLPRVMRLPGFYHMKSEPFQTKIQEPNDES
ncbi:DNA-primase RepB domain-containing protein [Magnetofaba australis]|uniref:DNA-primase RepB domain-containing protein n=1 Tax=Magnetofaba australis TaxID=1472297 RepID=UPI001301A324|nr:DNA-primase RepB domain-containing protein [Magnetofaba australis]